MLDDIKSYVERTGATIYCCDNPHTRTIGFVAKFNGDNDLAVVAEIMEEELPSWYAPLTAVKALKAMGNKTSRQELMSRALDTPEGKIALIQAINKFSKR